MPLYRALILTITVFLTTVTAFADPLPIGRYFADRDTRWGFSVSPTGDLLAWQAVKGIKPRLFLKPLDGSEQKTITVPDIVRWYTWSENGRYII